MYKLLRFYNQNRMKIWISIIGIIFIIVMIHILNSFIKAENQEKANSEETTENVVSYANESKSIITNGEVGNKYQKDFGSLIDEFYTDCINHQPEDAYELLSTDMKNEKYGSESLFEKLYYQDKFQGNKQYSFQSWSTGEGIYTYVIKIYDNMLATGKSSESEYIEDYVTIVEERGEYKLNIDGFLGKKNIDKEGSNEYLTINVGEMKIYTDYEIYTFRVKNNTDNTIYLDDRNNTNTIYLTDENENRYYALLYENNEEEFKIGPQEAKTIKIKFNVVYRNNLQLKKINFNNIMNEGETTNSSKMLTIEI